ncbi:hypothetical protein FRC07_011143 [Ceratobasidium sp. 392]|nr:hypothetical protein FRC07_011143 [Ceratobasidium sp. 392]
MSSITVRGRKYDAKEISNEAITFADDFAKKTYITQPLPANTDFTEAEDKEAQTQVCAHLSRRAIVSYPPHKLRAMLVLPPEVVGLMWAAFCARHINKMATALRNLSLEKQPKAFATYIQIMSLFPEARSEPYWRMFLRSSDSDGIANIVGNAFAQGVEWRRPSGPGFICGAIIELLFWCNTQQGDDKRASMDSKIRKAVARKTRAIKASDAFPRLDGRQQMEIERLDGILNVIDLMPEDTYLASTRDGLAGQVDGQCGNEDCDNPPTERCAKCKSVEYCGRSCQSKHWKKEHKVRCFERLS